jgi:hypothetical protein
MDFGRYVLDLDQSSRALALTVQRAYALTRFPSSLRPGFVSSARADAARGIC